MSDSAGQHRLRRGAALFCRRFFRHRVLHDSAALTYYLLFSVFPMLIFFNNLVGLLSIDADALLRMFKPVIPTEALDLIRQYLHFISDSSHPVMLAFSLFFSIYFPMRAVNSLLVSVRKAYNLPPPENILLHELKVLLYTIVLPVALAASLALGVVSKDMLQFLSEYVYLDEGFVRLWSSFRFVFLGVIAFAVLALLYFVARGRSGFRYIWPGILLSLLIWVASAMLFSLYVDQIGRYSVIYGSIGAIIVLLIWLYLMAMSLIIGAEFNGILEELYPPRKKEESA